jgi:hypothetical protein
MQGTSSGLCSLNWSKGRAESGLDGPFEHGGYWRERGERTYHGLMMRVKLKHEGRAARIAIRSHLFHLYFIPLQTENKGTFPTLSTTHQPPATVPTMLHCVRP